jgi:site-specific DNA-adenine methylase
MNYGVPYKGSKNLIVTKLAEAIPGAENFYDLFAGGCAVTFFSLNFQFQPCCFQQKIVPLQTDNILLISGWKVEIQTIYCRYSTITQ